MLYEEKLNECHRIEGSHLPLNIFTVQGNSSMHWHDFLEILYCEKGKYGITVSDESFSCETGDLVLINAKEPHATIVQEEDSEMTVLHIPVSLLYSYLNNDSYLWFYTAFLSGTIKLTRKHYSRESEITALLHKLFNEFKDQEHAFELECVAYVLLILSQLIRNKHISLNDNMKLKTSELELIGPALEHIKANYTQDITLQEISDLTFLSKSTVCKLFKSSTGMPFKEYLNEYRISEAKRLLVTTSEPITNIANAVGYANVTYFNRVFRNIHKISPSSFRNKYKDNLV